MKSILSLRPAIRSRNSCTYQDFYIDEKRLADSLDVGDFISPLGWLEPQVELHFRRILLTREPSDLKPDRFPIFICPECADYGCGVITAKISRQENSIIWSDFGYENDYDDELRQTDLGRSLLFEFDAAQYFEALSG